MTRLDTDVRGLYPAPAPRWHSTWQVAALFGINDSSVRALVERGAFPGAVKNYEGQWMISREGVIARLQNLIEHEKRSELLQPLQPAIPPAKREPLTYVLYRWYDVDDELLYVGQAKNAPRRTRQHEQDKEWWELVDFCTATHYPTLAAVLDAERDAIKNEHPIHNKVHNGRR